MAVEGYRDFETVCLLRSAVEIMDFRLIGVTYEEVLVYTIII